MLDDWPEHVGSNAMRYRLPGRPLSWYVPSLAVIVPANSSPRLSVAVTQTLASGLPVAFKARTVPAISAPGASAASTCLTTRARVIVMGVACAAEDFSR